MNIYNCSLIELPKVHNKEGNLTPVENLKEIPFKVKRVFYLYDVPGGESRGAHAHKRCHQFIVAASGAFEVLLDDGNVKRVVQLNRPYMGLHIPPGIWASEINFSSGSICLVLASHKYDENDYIRDYDEYLKSIHKLETTGNSKK
jgi:oxalate decarboxylase/phosphoglucose isomerase-like protein (cupin superfamily)